jgi:hypothetical protein
VRENKKRKWKKGGKRRVYSDENRERGGVKDGMRESETNLMKGSTTAYATNKSS